MLKVVMIARSTLYSIKGGDTVQVLQTAEQLRKAGVEVDIKCTNEQIDYNRYGLLHFFNIIRPADILSHIKRSGKPYVVSTIFVDYSAFDRLQRRGVAGKLLRSLSGDGIEYAKTLMRWLLGRDKLVSPAYLWKGQRRSIQYILEHASMLLPNSASEYNRLARQYDCEARYTVVPNGIDETIFKNDPSVERGRNLVICAARIEGIKNQLNLIRALNNTAYTLLLIGSPAPNQMEYYRLCRKAAAANVQFIDRITQPELARYYQSAQVHVLPSWFETTGLSSLEAAAAGCSVVITDRGDTREYFGDDAFYCDPADTRSIYDAVNKAAAAKPSETLQQRIAQQFSWRHAAFETLQAYHKVIGK